MPPFKVGQLVRLKRKEGPGAGLVTRIAKIDGDTIIMLDRPVAGFYYWHPDELERVVAMVEG